MLDSIIGYVKQFVGDAISNNPAIPDDKKDLAAQTASSALVDGFKEHFTSENRFGVTELFSGRGYSITDGLRKTVGDALTEKVGLSADVANDVSSSIVTRIIEAISKKVNDPNEKEFYVESVLAAFIGDKTDEKGGLLGAIGRFFG